MGGFGQVRLGQGETKMHRSQLYWIHSDTYWIHQIFKGREDVVSVARRQKFPHHTMAGVLHFCPKNIGIFLQKNVLNYCEKYLGTTFIHLNQITVQGATKDC